MKRIDFKSTASGIDFSCSEILVMGENNSPLYNLELSSSGDLIVSAHMAAKYQDVIFKEDMSISLHKKNTVSISRKECNSGNFPNQNQNRNAIPISFMINAARNNTAKKESHIVSELSICSEDDNSLFHIQLDLNGSLIITVTQIVRFDGVELLPVISAIPLTASQISFSRLPR